ncbi:MAG: hypothetical protein Fur0022_36470 [Anaerolineales bacterium]
MMKSSIHRARAYLLRRATDRRVLALAKQVQARSTPAPHQKPVIFFNASTRLGGISQNAAFATLSAMALQLAGVPVRYFACQAGLERCTLGVVINGPAQAPPCQTCIAQSKTLFAHAPTQWFTHHPSPDLDAALANLDLPALTTFEFPHRSHELPPIPLGPLTLPSLRWTLRIHTLPDDEPTRALYRAFIRSAYSLAHQFSAFLAETKPQSVVVFNGVSYPEATARWAAQQRGLRVITHEVAHQPLTAFFTDGQVTAYPVHIPDDFDLSPAQNARLDAYLQARFQGHFTMAGLQFWPEMKGLDNALLEKIAAHRRLVPIFTNVIFDTSQMHANTVFAQMFAWLDQIHQIIRAHPETLFVIRAHPDELRPNSRKQARETVDEWVKRTKSHELPNVVYISPTQYVSSYELIHRAHFVMAYNSTIGLEAVLMGKPVLNGGQARYTQYPIVYLPKTPAEHRQLAEEFLSAETVELPAEFMRNARRFQYYQLWRTPLPFDAFLEPHPTPGYVTLKDFPVEALEQSETMRVIVEGILDGKEFLMPEHFPDTN